jgi:hypothetical protein
MIELAKQAGYTPDMFGVGHWDMPECKKFAELIVQECVNELLRWKSEPFPFDAETGARVIKDLFRDKRP